MRTLFLESSAGLSPCGLYRYWLCRRWDRTLPLVSWIMLNPSTADHEADDPTIRRCMGFAERWGFGGIHVVNLFAYRSTEPTTLKLADDPAGPENDAQLVSAGQCGRIIAGWGVGGEINGRGKIVSKMLRDLGVKLECLGVTKIGHPKHPLYIASATEPVPFEVTS